MKFVPVEPVSALITLIVLQAGYYVSLGMGLILINNLVLARGATIADLFCVVATSKAASTMVALVFAHMLAVGPFVLMIAVAVQHVSHVLDHVATAVAIHAAVRWCFFGFPTTAAFWCLAIADVAVFTFLGEIAVARRDSVRLSSISMSMEQPHAPAKKEDDRGAANV